MTQDKEVIQPSQGYQLFVTSITWNKTPIKHFQKKGNEELPEQASIDLPQQIADQEKSQDFKDTVESFVYNLLTRKYGHEVYSCQIWLPLEEEQKN